MYSRETHSGPARNLAVAAPAPAIWAYPAPTYALHCGPARLSFTRREDATHIVDLTPDPLHLGDPSPYAGSPGHPKYFFTLRGVCLLRQIPFLIRRNVCPFIGARVMNSP